MTHIVKFGPGSILSSDMLVHWVKVIWAKDGGSGTPWGPTIIFSEKKSASLNSMTLEPNHEKPWGFVTEGVDMQRQFTD